MNLPLQIANINIFIPYVGECNHSIHQETSELQQENYVTSLKVTVNLFDNATAQVFWQ